MFYTLFPYILFCISCLLGNILFIKFGNKLKLSDRIQDQNIHMGSISRLGGLVIYGNLFIFSFFLELSILLKYCIIASVMIIPAILEDLHFNINPLVRLFLIILSSFILLLDLDYLPVFNFGIMNLVFNNYQFQIIFLSLSLAAVTNGQNIIDGTNGLSALSSLSTFCCIFYLAYQINDQLTLEISLFVIIAIIIFLIFNYPFGKIFLGDCGSYLLGMLSGYLIIKIFSENPLLPSWVAVIILFYPSLELIFSYIRRLRAKRSPFIADNNHLHLKIYYMLSYKKKDSILHNALVAPFMAIIWLLPLVSLPVLLDFPHFSFLAMIIIFCVYIFIYFAIPNYKNFDKRN